MADPLEESASTETDLPKSVIKTQKLTWSRVSKSDQRRLLDLCFGIYRSRSSTLAKAEFEKCFFSHPSLRLALFYDAAGQICGFSNASLLAIHAGAKQYYVFSAGVYFMPGYRGGIAASLFGLGESLRHKLRAPHRRLAYVPMASNPAPYHLIARYALRYWPRPEATAPTAIETLLQEVVNVRRLTPVVDDLWRVRTFVQPDDVEKVRQSRRLRHQQSVRFFEQRNPTWSDPHCATALLMWVPLDTLNITVALWRMLLSRKR